jgi:lipopolysaccharide transport system permease protein
VIQTQLAPTSIIRKRSSWANFNVKEIWQFKDLLLAFIEKDIKLRYRQTALGIAWILIQPLLGAAIFSVVFHKVAGLQAPSGVPYFILSFAGLLCWNSFSTSFVRSSTAIVQNAGLISKVYFPRVLLPLSSGFGSLIDFAIGFAALLLMLVLNHIHIGRAVCAAPMWCLVCILLGVGLGLLSGSLMVWYRDVQYLAPVALQFLLYGSPVAYTLTQALHNVPRSIGALYCLNPLAGVMESFRDLIFGEPLLQGIAVYSVLCSLGIFVAGLLFFTQMERKFADVI